MRVYSVYGVDENVYVGTVNSGMAISRDSGESFPVDLRRLDGSGILSVFADGEHVHVGIASWSGGGLAISRDSGGSFSHVAELNGSDVSSVYVNGKNVYAGMDSGLAISQDSGDSFEIYTTKDGLSSNWVDSITSDGKSLFVCTDGGLSMLIE